MTSVDIVTLSKVSLGQSTVSLFHTLPSLLAYFKIVLMWVKK